DVPGKRPADILISRLHNGLPTAIDIAVQERFSSTDNPAEKYALETKHHKYDEGFNGTNIEFCAAVVETFGNKEGEEVRGEIIRRAAKRQSTEPGPFISVYWQKLSSFLQIMNARATLSRISLPESGF